VSTGLFACLTEIVATQPNRRATHATANTLRARKIDQVETFAGPPSHRRLHVPLAHSLLNRIELEFAEFERAIAARRSLS
jgi:hypothetical protein